MAKKKNTTLTGEDLMKLIVEGMQDKKGKEITAIDLRNVSGASSNYFVICHGQTDRQANAIAQSIEEYVFKNAGIWPYHSEGYENKEWILLDYFDVVAHVFIEERRHFFAIEDLWADAKQETFETVE